MQSYFPGNGDIQLQMTLLRLIFAIPLKFYPFDIGTYVFVLLFIYTSAI